MLALIMALVVAAALAGIVTQAVDASFPVTFPPECRTRVGMNRAQCTLLNQFWIKDGSPCLAMPGITRDMKLAVAPFTTWVGSACPTPCARDAKKLRQNPKAYCRARGLSADYNDGGCRTILDCESLHCSSTCNSQPNCAWTGSELMGVCRSNVLALCSAFEACANCFADKQATLPGLPPTPSCDGPQACAVTAVQNKALARRCVVRQSLLASSSG